MLIEQTFQIDAPRAAVASFLEQPERMLYCVPGVEEVEPTDHETYKATLRAKVGPIRASFTGEVSIDASQSPDLITASGEGRDRATGTIAKVTLDAKLVEEESGVTTVQSSADVALRGRLGQFGTGVIQAIASEMIEQFAKCVEQRCMNEDISDEAMDEVSPNLASAAVRGVARSAASKISSIRQRDDKKGE